MLQLSPYIIVDDVEQALAFYKTAFGGEIKILNQTTEQILHAELHISNTVVLHVSSNYGKATSNENTNIILTFDNLDEQSSAYEALRVNGEPHMPLKKTFFNAMHGQVKDQFQVNWLMNCFLS